MSMGTLSKSLAGLDNEALVNALAADDWQHPSGSKGHLVREILYDEIAHRHVATPKALAAVMLGLFREPRESHAFSACISCLVTISGAPETITNGLLSHSVAEAFGTDGNTDRLDALFPLILYSAARLASKGLPL